MKHIDNFLDSLRDGLPKPNMANPELAALATPEAPRCWRCGQLAENLPEYVEMVIAELDEEDEVLREKIATKIIDGSEESIALIRDAMRVEEGTYNRATGGFYCISCYIAVGLPLGVAP